METKTYTGGCHCGKVKWEIEAPLELTVQECNCSRCSMIGFLHLIVPHSRFRLLTDKAFLTTYTFNSKVAQHYFCSTCGVQSYYIPRSNPDGFSINVRCIDNPGKFIVEPFDGKNWEANAASLAHLSKE